MFSPFNCFRGYIFFATKYLSFTIRSWIVLTYLSFANSSCSFLSPNPREDNVLANSFSAFSSRLKVVRIAIFLSFDISLNVFLYIMRSIKISRDLSFICFNALPTMYLRLTIFRFSSVNSMIHQLIARCLHPFSSVCFDNSILRDFVCRNPTLLRFLAKGHTQQAQCCSNFFSFFPPGGI